MKAEQIFIGNINKCTKYEQHDILKSELIDGITGEVVGCQKFGYIEREGEVYKENAILIRLQNGGYVDIDNLNSILDHLSVHRDITKDGYRAGRLIMPTLAWKEGCLYVDESTLRKCYSESESQDKVTVRSLKQKFNKDNN